MKTDEFTLNVGELKDLPGAIIKSLTITSKNVNVWLRWSGATVFSFKPDPQLRGICSQVTEVLDRNKRWFRDDKAPFYFFATIVLATTAFLSNRQPIPLQQAVLWLMIGILTVWSVTSSIDTVRGHCIIILKHRKDAPSFWQKYQDDLKKTAITALIAGAVGFGFGRLSDWFKMTPPQTPQQPISQPLPAPTQPSVRP